MLNKKNILIVVTVIVLAVMLMPLVVYLIRNNSSKIDPKIMLKYNEDLQTAKKYHFANDHGKAIDAFTKLLNYAPNKTEEGMVKLFLADNYINRKENNDTLTGIALYKDLIKDPSTSPGIKSKALIFIAFLVIGHDESYYRQYFNEDFYKDLMPSEGSNSLKVRTAFKNFLELSDKIYPNSNAKYTLAGNYYAGNLVNSRTNGTSSEEIARIIQKYVSEADKINDQDTYSTDIQMQRLFFRALAINASSRVLNNFDLKEREKAFVTVLEFAEMNKIAVDQDFKSQAILMRARFYYANFLREYYADSRSSDIVTILKPFETISNPTDQRFDGVRIVFQRLLGSQDNNFQFTNASLLAKISPEFKKFTDSIGVKF